MHKYLVFAGAVTCFLGVAFGAFGAHALDHVLQGKAVSWYDTAVQYQFIHGIGLLFCGLAWPMLGRRSFTAAIFMFGGMLIFCGSLFAMALGAPRWLGMITPVGGVCLMIAWLILAWCAIRHTDRQKTT